MARQTGIMKNEPQSLVHSSERPTVIPACDVYENDSELLLIADLPGVEADTLKINADQNELTLSGHCDVPKEGSYVASEYRECEYSRRFALPGGIDATRISAELKEGVLWLHLPKSEALKPRQIAVKAG